MNQSALKWIVRNWTSARQTATYDGWDKLTQQLWALQCCTENDDERSDYTLLGDVAFARMGMMREVLP